MVLYRKYRPQALSDVVGQDHVRDPLLAALRGGKITHAYLFSGPRGTGKTSVARILAKAVNCLSHEANSKLLKGTDKRPAIGDMRFGEPCNECAACLAITQGSYLDLIEIDAASNRGIDEIRDLREKIKLSPAGGRYKVYIIDEAHMLTPEAFNALLKTLEEPPEHAIFILATTEPQKIPATIASRATRFDFKVPNVPQIKEKLSLITKQEGWGLREEVLEEIAKFSAGAFRDAEVLLEKVASVDSSASLEKTREILGRREATSVIHLLKLIQKNQSREALLWLDKYLETGGSIRVLAESTLEVIRKVLLLQAGAESVVGVVTEEELKELEDLSKKTTKQRLLGLTVAFNKAIVELRDATIPQLPVEIAIIGATLGEEESLDEEKSVTTGDTDDKEITTLPVGRQATKAQKKVEAQGDIEEQKTATPETSSTTEDIEKKIEDAETKITTAETKKDTKTLKMESAESKVLKKLQKDWDKFLKELKPKNSSLEMFLREAKPVDLDEDLLTIEFAYRFHKEKVEERKYREVVQEVLEKFTGQNLRIKGIVGVRPTEPKKEESTSTVRKEDVDPVEIFGKLE